MQYLVVIETPGIHSYLFASPWLQEIRGAGVLLDLLNRREIKMLPKRLGASAFARLFLGGGVGRILFGRGEDARAFVEAVRDRYRENGVSAHAAVQLLERRPGQMLVDWVGEGVGLARSGFAVSPRTEASPMAPGARPCSSCGNESVPLAETGPGGAAVCPACLKKRRAADRLYGGGKPAPKGYRPLESAHNLARRYSNKFIVTTLAQANEAEGYSVYVPASFEAIGRASRPAGYVGLLHASANRVGEAVRRLGSLCGNDEEAARAYRACSEIVDRAIRDAAVEAVLERVAIKTVKELDRFIPAEFILGGGEDLLLAVPAQNALDVAVHFMGAFQKKTVELQEHFMEKKDLKGFFAPNGLTASVGVVLAHAHHPFGDLSVPVAQLLTQAKARSAALSRQLTHGEAGGEETGTVDFMVFRDGGTGVSGEKRDPKAGQSAFTSTSVSLTGRPHTCSEAKRFLETVRALKSQGVTSSKLRSLLVEASRELGRTPVGVDAGSGTAENRAVGHAVQELLARVPHPPFHERSDGGWSTCFMELEEVYDFINLRQ